MPSFPKDTTRVGDQNRFKENRKKLPCSQGSGAAPQAHCPAATSLLPARLTTDTHKESDTKQSNCLFLQLAFHTSYTCIST